MDDYSIVRDDYYYIKERAFKDIRNIADTSRVRPIEEFKQNVPEKREESTNREYKPESETEDLIEAKKHERKIFCPLDGTLLQTLPLQKVYIDYCRTCYGIWLDLGELERLLGKKLDASKVFSEKLARPVPSREEIPIHCPLCKVEMEKHCHFEADITSDICPVCGGIWLDSGEFASLYLEKKHQESAHEILAQVLGKYVDIEA